METETLDIINQSLHILMRKLDRKDISEEEYKVKYQELIQKRRIHLDERIKNVKQKINERIENMPNVAPEVKKVVAKKETKTATPSAEKPKKLTRVSAILEALQMKSVKNMEQAVDRVVEKLPGSDRKKVAAQISLTVGMVKKGKGALGKYSWNEEEFMLSLKA